jgi:hypothetical protein
MCRNENEEDAMADVFEMLGAAHREVEQMLDIMDSLIGAPAQPAADLRNQGSRLAAALIAAVSQHEAAEQEYFWPIVQKKVTDGHWLAAGGIEQEIEGEKLLTDLDGMPPDDERFAALMTQFSQAARAHIDYEEQQVWPLLRGALTQDEASDLGDQLAKVTQAGM